MQLRPLVFALSLASLPSLAQFGGDAIRLPELSGSAQALFTPEEERLIGEAFMRSVRRQLSLENDPLIAAYVEELGDRLAASSDRPGRRYHFFAVRAKDINAFAGPDGWIGVHTGLILAARSEDELAAVIAHEIAHVTQDHLLRGFEANQYAQLPIAAAVIAGLILSQVSSQAGEAALTGTLAGTAQRQLDYTRAHEHEADRVGMQILHGAGFDPRAMPGFFERLQESARYSGQSAPEFLRTHPVTTHRIADAQGRAEQYPYRQRLDSLDFHLVRKRLALQTNRPEAWLAEQQTQLKDGAYSNETAQRYAVALGQLALGEATQASTLLRPLLAQNPQNRFLLLAMAQAEYAQGKRAEARDRLRSALNVLPGNPALTLHLAEWDFAQKQAEQSLDALRQAVNLHPLNPSLREAYARHLGANGQPIEGHIEMAEQEFLLGRTEAAILQLKRAQNLATKGRSDREHGYQLERIDARIVEMEAYRKAEEALPL
jgi:predicted Zn-dependent protease